MIYHTKSGGNGRQTVASTERIFFAHGRVLWAFARGAGGYGLAWSFKAAGRITTDPVIGPKGDAVYFGDAKGNFYRLEADD